MKKDNLKEYKKHAEKIAEQNRMFEASLQVKPSTAGKIRFFLAALRPVTKIELAHVSQAVVQNRRLLNNIVLQINALTIKVAEISGYLQGRGSTSSKEVCGGVAKKAKKNKDDVMYG